MVRVTKNQLIVFDLEEALSFEGATGPYLQYAVVRARNILSQAGPPGADPATGAAREFDERLSPARPRRSERSLGAGPGGGGAPGGGGPRPRRRRPADPGPLGPRGGAAIPRLLPSLPHRGRVGRKRPPAAALRGRVVLLAAHPGARPPRDSDPGTDVDARRRPCSHRSGAHPRAASESSGPSARRRCRRLPAGWSSPTAPRLSASRGRAWRPALRSGERVLVNKIGVRLGGIGRGDVVVFHDPADSGIVMVKRIVAVPGDNGALPGRRRVGGPGAG